jgi:bifunctional oligoribonuclease and PAP phosphatase NrnA
MHKQNYKESQEILEEITKAKKILVNLHRGPDPDSFACAFSLYYFLCSLGKEVDIVLAANSKISDQLGTFADPDLIKHTDYSKLDFSNYDLFIVSDSASWQQVVDNEQVKIPKIPVVVIDHHGTNERFGNLNLIEEGATSCSEVLYKLFQDWKFEISKQISELLLVGIIGDTGGFAFYDNPQPLRIAADLMSKGVSKTQIINKIFRTKKFEEVKVWGEFLTRMEFDKQSKFVWMALSYEDYKMFGKPSNVLPTVATMFAALIEGTDFGIVMLEKENNVMFVSLRSREGFDVSKIASELGGGGHNSAAAASVNGLEFEKAVEKVLETARKYAKENG